MRLGLMATLVLGMTAAGWTASGHSAHATTDDKGPQSERIGSLSAMLAEEPIQVIVSLKEQRLRVYRGGEIIEESNVSSGKRGYTTPTGIFSILHKKKRHFSNIYRGAPMPYMQRLTWTGIALHGSNSVPRRPASHGCIRLPRGFDSKLFKATEAGGHVLIAREFPEPRLVSHPTLPSPGADEQFDPLMDHWRILADAGGSLGPATANDVATAELLAPVRAEIARPVIETGSSDEPLRILISRRTQKEIATDIQRLLNLLGYDVGAVDGIIGPDSRKAVRQFRAAYAMAPGNAIDDAFTAMLYTAAGLEKPKNGKISVRQNFEPLFDASFAIKEPHLPLGTHLLVTSRFDANAGQTGWKAYTLRNAIGPTSRALYGIEAEASDEVALADALARIDIPELLRERINARLTPGSSIAIADNGTDRYTGWKTDFAVVTNDRADKPRTASAPKKPKVKRRTSQRSRPHIVRASTAGTPIRQRRATNLPGVWLSR